jgi:hypothetical protein
MYLEKDLAMRIVKWVFGLLVLAVVGLFLSYVLPKRDVIYITDAYNRFVEPGELRGVRAMTESATDPNGRLGADVLFIVGRSRGGALREYRNEDTGFGFPWYFKFDTATLDNQAREAVSTPETPKWMIVRYYGWRVPFLSMFPNAISMEPAPSRDVRLIPWFNIILLVLLIAAVWAIWARIRRWSQRRRDPMAASWQTPTQRRGWFGR